MAVIFNTLSLQKLNIVGYLIKICMDIAHRFTLKKTLTFLELHVIDRPVCSHILFQWGIQINSFPLPTILSRPFQNIFR